MELIDFRDNCVVSRSTGGRDEWDNLVYDTVYSGACLYQEGSANSSREITIKNPTVFLPEVVDSVKINDKICIHTEFGREINGVVELVRDVNLPIRKDTKVTRIELKQAMGD